MARRTTLQAAAAILFALVPVSSPARQIERIVNICQAVANIGTFGTDLARHGGLMALNATAANPVEGG